MSHPINLNKVRKERNRAARKSGAEENVVKHGQTKAQKDAHKKQNEQAVRTLDGHKRER